MGKDRNSRKKDTERNRGDDKPAARTAARSEFEVAYYTEELGRPLQREMLQAKFELLNDEGRIEPAHRNPAQDAVPPGAEPTQQPD
jgi:hypothetical protein